MEYDHPARTLRPEEVRTIVSNVGVPQVDGRRSSHAEHRTARGQIQIYLASSPDGGSAANREIVDGLAPEFAGRVPGNHLPAS